MAKSHCLKIYEQKFEGKLLNNWIEPTLYQVFHSFQILPKVLIYLSEKVHLLKLLGLYLMLSYFIKALH